MFLYFHTMTLFFDLDNVQLESQGNPARFVALLDFYFRGGSIFPKKFGKPPKLPLAGKGWILNPAPLLAQVNSCDTMHIVQYVKLAAKRDYTMYKMYGVKHLDIREYPDLLISKLKHNPLLEIVGHTIKFKFEESYNGKGIW